MGKFGERFRALSRQYQEYLCAEHQFSLDEAVELPWRRVAFLAYAFVLFFVGLPVWWITTTPYRAQLPHFGAEIEQKIAQLHADSAAVTTVGTDNDVWHFLRAQSDYSIHLIFVHSTNGQKGAEPHQQEILYGQRVQRKLEQFAHKFFAPIGIRVEIGSEHLWDFSLADYLCNNQQQNQQHHQQQINRQITADGGNRTIDISASDAQVPASLCSELDSLVGSAPLGQEPLLKLALFFPPFHHDDGDDQQIQIRFTHGDGEPTDGLAIASWGGLFIAPSDHRNSEESATLNAIVAVLQHQFAIHPMPSSPQDDGSGKRTAMERTLSGHKRRLAVENLYQTVRTLHSLHDLAEQISDLVIPEEVAQLAAQSKALFLHAFHKLVEEHQIDAEAAAQARRLSARANTDPRLLELLNFPADQKYGVYVPLFLPMLVPMLQPLALFVAFLVKILAKSLKERRRKFVAEREKKAE